MPSSIRKVIVPLFASAVIGVVSLSCSDDTAPEIARNGRISFVPTFSSQAASVVDVDRIRVILIRTADGSPALDTTVSLGSSSDSVDLSLNLPVLSSDEQFTATIHLLDAQGDTVFVGGPLQVTASTGSAASTPVVEIPLAYTGIGSDAASIRILTNDAFVSFGDSVTLVAEALDGAGDPIAGTPIFWRTLNPDRAAFPNAGTGLLVAQPQRGDATVIAELLTGPADTTVVAVQPVASALALIGTDGQTGQVGQTLPESLSVRVTAADGLGLKNVPVVFSASDTTGSFSKDTVLTDSTGFARVSWQLGRFAGAQAATATVTDLASVTFTATAAPGPPATMTVPAGDGQVATAGSPVPIDPVFAVADSFGNAVPGIQVSFQTQGGGTVELSAATTDSTGSASPGTWTLGTAAGENTLVALIVVSQLAPSGATADSVAVGDKPDRHGDRLPGPERSSAAPGDTLMATVTATSVPGQVADLVIVSGNQQEGVVGAQLAAPIVARVVDEFGNPVAGQIVNFVVTSGNGAVFAGTNISNETGTAQELWTLGTSTADSQIVEARAVDNDTGDPITFAVFVAIPVPGPTDSIAFTQQPTNFVAGDSINPAVEVSAFDQFGNLAVRDDSTSITLSLAAGTGTSGASLLGDLVVGVDSGVALFPGLSIDSAGPGYQLEANSTPFGPATSQAFNVAPGQPATVSVSADADSLFSISDTTRVTAEVRDSLGNIITGATVTWSSSDPAVATVDGFGKVTAIGNGSAYVRGSTNPSDSVLVTVWQIPAVLAFTSQPATTSAGEPIADFQVSILDSLGSVATNDNSSIVDIAILVGTGTPGAALSGQVSDTAVAGVATFAGISIDSAGVDYQLVASVTGLELSFSAAFDITLGSPATIAVAIAADSLFSLGDTTSVTAVVRDAGGNEITDATVTWESTDSSVVTVDASGVVTAAGNGSAYILGTANPSDSVLIVVQQVGTRLAFTNPLGNTTAGTPFAADVEVRDALGNTVTSDDTTSITVGLSGGNPAAVLSGIPTGTVSGGTISIAALSIDSAGIGYQLTATASGLSDATSNTFDVAVGAPASITVTLDADSLFSLGETANATALVQDAGGNVIASPTVTWESTDSSVVTVDASGVVTATGNGSAYLLGTVNPSDSVLIVVQQVGTRLAFTNPLGSTTAGTPFAADVEVRDALGNTVTSDDTTSITVGLSGGNPAAVLSGIPTGTVSGGTISIAALSIDSAGIGYRLTATASGLSDATSNTFDVAVGVPASISVTLDADSLFSLGETANATALVQDAGGNVIASPTVTWESTDSSVVTVDASGVVTAAGNGSAYILGTANPSDSVLIVVQQVGTQLAFTNPLGNTTAGTPFAADVEVRDALGNTVTSDDTTSITVGLSGGDPAAVLSGIPTGTVSGGTISIAALSIDSAGTGYQLTATASGLSDATSNTFDVAIGAPASITVTLDADSLFSLGETANATALVQDAGGNVIASPTVTWESTDSSVATVDASGVVTAAGNGSAYILGTANPSDSALIVVRQVATSLGFTTQPQDTTATSPIPTDVAVLDALGNTITDGTTAVTIAIVTGSGTAGAVLSGTNSVMATAGVASFTDLSIDSVGTAYRLAATATGLIPDTSTVFDIGIGAPASIAVMLNADSLFSFGSTANASAVVADSGGNIISNPNLVWESTDSSVATVDSSGVVTAVGNGNAYIIGTVNPSDSALITVWQIPGAIAFTSQPATTAAAEFIPSFQISVLDSLGNVATNDNSSVVDLSILIGTGTAGAMLSGQLSDTVVAGVATFADISIDSAGVGYQFDANVAGLAIIFSDSFDILVGAPDSVATTLAADSLFSLNDTTTASAMVWDAGGNVISSPAVVWESTDSSVATIDSTGLVTAVGNGSAGIIATSGTAASTSIVTVSQVPASITFTSQPVTTTATDTIPSFQVSVLDSLGSVATNDNSSVVDLSIFPGPTGPVLSGQLSDTVVAGVATFADLVIDSAGVGYQFDANVAGLAIIFSDSFDILVGSPDSILVTLPVDSLFSLNDTTTASATVWDAGGNEISSPAVTWESTDSSVATVDSTGLITAAGNGSAYIKGTTNPSDSALIVVRQIATSLSFTSQPQDTTAASPIPTTVSVLDALGNTVTDDTTSISIAIASGTGTSGATLSGTTSIAATAGVASFTDLAIDSAGTAYQLVATAASLTATSTAFDINIGTPASIVVTLDTDSLFSLGETAGASALVQDAGGNVISSPTVTWESTDSSVATVDSTGLVVATGNGSAYIKGTANPSDSALIVVNQVAASLVATANDTLLASLADTTSMDATVYDSLGAAIVGAPVSWTSTNPSVATVDAAGLVTAIGNGTTYIIGTNSQADSVLITVNQVAASVAVTATTDSLFSLGDTTSVFGLVSDALGSTITGAPITWSSSGPSVATVDSTGLVTAVTNGDVYIRATSSPATDSVLVVVNQKVTTVSITSIVTQDTIATADTILVSADALDALGSLVAGAQITWSSSDTTVVTIDSLTGQAAGVSQGTASIFAASGTAIDTVLLTVLNPAPLGTSTSWTGATDNSWTDASNWDNGVPLASENAYIRVTATNQPTVSADTAVNDLTLETGATVIVASGVTLTVNGNLDAGYTSVDGLGTVRMAGAAATISGSVPAVEITGTVSASDSLRVNGALTVKAGDFSLAGNLVRVFGDFATDSTGTLTMTNAADTLNVVGNVTFGGGGTDLKLTNGLINTNRNFTQLSTYSTTSFAASGSHRVAMNGDSVPTVSFASPGNGNSRFAKFSWVGIDTLTLATPVVVRDTLAIESTLPVAINDTLHTQGQVILDPGSEVSGTVMEFRQTPDVFGSYFVNNTIWNSTALTTIPTTLSYDTLTGTGIDTLNIAYRAQFAGNMVINGDLWIAQIPLASATPELTINGNTVRVMGRLILGDTTSAGRSKGTLYMQNAADSLIVLGDAWFGGSPMTTELNNGFLDLKGNFTQFNRGASQATFLATGAHTTLLSDSSSGQVVNFEAAGVSAFNDLLLAHGTDSLYFVTDAHVQGDLTSSNGFASLYGAGYTLTVDGNVSLQATLTVDTLAVAGTLASTAEGFNTNVVRFTGTSQTIPSALNYTDIHVTGSASPDGNVSAVNLTVDDGASLNIIGFDINAAGNISGGYTSVSGTGTIRAIGGTINTISGKFPNLHVRGKTMTASDSVIVTGNLLVSSSAGDFNLGGNRVEVSGTFRTDTSAVITMTTGGDSLIVGDSTYFGGGPTNTRLTNGAIEFRGPFTQTSGLNSYAPSGAFNEYFNGTALQTVSFGFPADSESNFRNVKVMGGATVEFLSNINIVGGSLTIQDSAHVNFGSGATTVGTSIVVSDSGSFAMTSDSAYVKAFFDVTIGGAALGPDSLSAGLLEIGRHFTEAGAIGRFLPDTSHLTRFSGAQASNVSFLDGTSAFGTLSLTGTGGIDLLGETRVEGRVEGESSSIRGDSVQMVVGSDFNPPDSVSLAILVVGGDLLVPNTVGYSVTNTVFNGGFMPRIPYSLTYDQLTIEADPVLLSDSGTVNANYVVVRGAGQLEVRGGSLYATDSLRTMEDGTIQMDSASGLVETANAFFDGGSTAGLLTGGTLNVFGDFLLQTNATSDSSFFATTGHTTGLGSTTVVFATPDTLVGSHFGDLLVENAPFTEFVSVVPVAGSARFADNGGDFGPTVFGIGELLVAGDMNFVATGGGIDFQVSTIRVGGTFRPDSTFSSQVAYDSLRVLEYFGSGQAMAFASPGDTIFITGDSVTVNGSQTIPGKVVVSGNGMLDVRDTTSVVVVGGNFETRDSGRLRMIDGPPTLRVNGNASFGGGSTAGLLTAGTLRIHGNFSQSGSSTAFAPSGSHTTWFAEGPLQTVAFTNPGPALSHFALLSLDPAGDDTVRVLSDVYATNLYVADQASGGGHTELTGDFSVIVEESTTLNGNSGFTAAVSVDRMVMYGGLSLTAFGTAFNPDTAEFAGSGQAIPTLTNPLNLVLVSGDSVLLDSLVGTINSDVVVTGLLDVSSASTFASISGDFTTAGSGRLRMTSGGVLSVQGNATFAGGSTDGYLTAGQLHLFGDFTQDGTSDSTSFAPGTGHLTWFRGDSLIDHQGVDFATPGRLASGFGRILFNPLTADTLEVLSTVYADSFTVSDAASNAHVEVIGSNRIVVDDYMYLFGGGLFTAQVSNDRVELHGALAFTGPFGSTVFTPDTVEFARQGGVQVLPSHSNYNEIRITGDSVVPAGNMTLSNGANVLVADSGLFDLDSSTVTVTGTFGTTAGGRLRMSNPAGNLTVYGDITFAGGSTEGALTAGTLNVLGTNFAQTSGTAAFAASSGHTTQFNGPGGSQTIYFIGPDSTQSRFGRLVLDPDTALTVSMLSDVFASDVYVSDFTSFGQHVELSGNGNLVVSDTIIADGFTGATAQVSPRKVSVMNVLRFSGAIAVNFSPDTVEFLNPGIVQIPTGPDYNTVIVDATSARVSRDPSNGDSLFIAGNLDVKSGARLYLDSLKVAVAGNVNLLGALVMDDPSSVLDVEGSFSATGDTLTMTAGILKVAGDFDGGVTSFFGGPSHRTILDNSNPTVRQILVLDGGYFGDLELAPSGAAISMIGDVQVLDQLIDTDAGIDTIITDFGQTMTVADLNVTGLYVDNMPLVVRGTSGGLTFDDVTFANMATDVIQLSITADDVEPTFDGVKFLTTPTTGLYVFAKDSLTVGDFIGTNITFANSFPVDGSAYDSVSTANDGASITWPTMLTSQWTGASSTSWTDANNWSPIGVPDSTSNVYIPSAPANQPSIASGTQYANELYVQSGATLTIGGGAILTTLGTVNADYTSIAGAGTVVLNPAGLVSVAGSFPNVNVWGPVQLSDSMVVNGNLAILGAGSPSLAVNGHKLRVTGTMSTSGSGTLTMSNAADTVQVAGSMSYGGAAGVFNAGTLLLGGSFAQAISGGGDTTNFNATGTHQVVFNGTGLQTISFASPSDQFETKSQFANLRNENTSVGGVLYATSTFVDGSLVDTAGTTIKGIGSNRLIFKNLDVNNAVIDGLQMSWLGGTFTRFDNSTLQNMVTTTNQIWVRHPGGNFAFDGLTFNSTPTSGHYLQTQDTSVNSTVLIIDITNAGLPFNDLCTYSQVLAGGDGGNVYEDGFPACGA